MAVYKDYKGDWYIKYKNKTKRGFSTKKEAEKYEARMKLGEAEGCEGMTFNDLALDYLNYKKGNTTYGTYSKYEYLYHNVIAKIFPVEKKVNAIDKMTCRRFYDDVGKMDRSTKYKNDLIRELKAIFKHGLSFFDIKSDPSSSIVRFKKTYEDMLKTKGKEMNIWTVEEFERFIKEIDVPVYKYLFIVLYYTGMRLGEALALKWKDYDGNAFDIYKSITYKADNKPYEEKQPKNANSIRKVVIGENIASMINSFKEEEMKIAGFKETWYIFGRVRPLAPTSIDRYKDNACNRAGIKRIRVHDLRHSHASYLISKGVNVVLVSRRLGHSDINITLKVYTHLFKNDEMEISELLNKSSQNLLKTYA